MRVFKRRCQTYYWMLNGELFLAVLAAAVPRRRVCITEYVPTSLTCSVCEVVTASRYAQLAVLLLTIQDQEQSMAWAQILFQAMGRNQLALATSGFLTHQTSATRLVDRSSALATRLPHFLGAQA